MKHERVVVLDALSKFASSVEFFFVLQNARASIGFCWNSTHGKGEISCCRYRISHGETQFPQEGEGSGCPTRPRVRSGQVKYKLCTMRREKKAPKGIPYDRTNFII